MTSEDIRRTPPAEMSTNAWLKEIAAQLAVINERSIVEEKPAPIETVPAPQPKRGRGRPRIIREAA